MHRKTGKKKMSGPKSTFKDIFQEFRPRLEALKAASIVMADRGFVEASKMGHSSRLQWHGARVGHLVVNKMKCDQDLLLIDSWIVSDLTNHAYSCSTTLRGCLVSSWNNENLNIYEDKLKMMWQRWSHFKRYFVELYNTWWCGESIPCYIVSRS